MGALERFKFGAILSLSVLAAASLRTPRGTAIAQTNARPGSSRDSLKTDAERTLSPTRGTLIPGLHHPVEVLRDSWGVPRIYAKSQHDLFFAQGFVTAQDRLFQMELWKRVGQGRLAEVLGPKYLQRDINARLLAYRGPMDVEYKSYAPDAEEILEAFTQGINAEIAERTAPGGPGLPLEFKLSGFAPQPWKPEDVLTRMAGFSMTNNSLSELQNAKLIGLLGREKAASLLNLEPPVPLDPAPGVDFYGLSPELLNDLQGSDSAMPLPPNLTNAAELPDEPGNGKWASNNWVVSGKLTATGRPLLSNDPHRTVDKVPSLRYIVHLVGPGWNVIGATEPGSPGVEAGHNQRIAWGWTVFGMDQQDLYLEKLDPADPLRYKTESGWATMKVERTSFHVWGKPDVRIELKFTRHGPVLWQDEATHRALALRWIGAEPGTAGYLACLSVDRAQNWQQFEAAVERWKLPTHNIVYADIEGNIGEHSVGMAPIRKDFTGLVPEPGEGGYEWSGFVPVSELPHQFNPEKGFVATANQIMILENFPYKVGFEWADPYRFNRITEMLAEAAKSGHKLTKEDMERMQSDVISPPARELVRLLSSIPHGDDASTQLLLLWNAATDRESAAAALYEVWLPEVRKAMHQCLLPGNVVSQLRWDIPLRIVLDHLARPDAETFGSQPATARDKLLRDTLGSAVRRLQALQGPDPVGWSWGRLHSVRFHHVLELLPGVESLVDLGPVPRPGDTYTVNNTHFNGEDFDQVSGPSYREIMDVGAWDNSVATNVPGQSGQPGSPHYSDLLPLWDQMHYFPLLYSRPAIERQAKDRLLLEPGP